MIKLVRNYSLQQMLSPIGLIRYLQSALQSDRFEIFERLSRLCLAGTLDAIPPMSNIIWYTARNTYDSENKEDFSWEKYIAWSKLTQLTELVSLDGMLNELSFEPNLQSEEDWKYIVTDGDYVTDLFSSDKYVLEHVTNQKYFNFLAVIKDPTEDSGAKINDEFEFVGYELLDEDYGVSALTNCGGFDETFKSGELNNYGLISGLQRAIEVKKDLVKNNPEEHHADCNLFGVWRHKSIGRK